MKLFIVIIMTFVAFNAVSQSLTQTVRGTIKDKETLESIIGAKFELFNSDPFLATVSDYDGKFRLENVPIGKQTFVVSYLGYDIVVLRNIDVNSKEVVLTLGLEESVEVMKEVTVTGHKKGETLNKMATVSSRSFSIDESKRYAGSLNDVSRMAQNYAGVQGGSDDRNDIIIRGNSPTGVLYKMEGVDIPNPNHFARFGTTGGPISILNNNVLSNSDFMTSAFPAEYGNAIAGVFDLKMRTGNNEKHEFMFQFGFNGAELMAEGPLHKKSGASYLINYRYNDLILFKKLGLNFGTNAIPTYQDISFKLNFPNKRGVTSLFGIGGLSNVELLAIQVDTNDLFAIDNSNTYFTSNVGVVGLNHKQRIGKSAYFNVSSSFQSAFVFIKNDTLDVNFENPFTTYYNQSTISKWSSKAFINKKFSAKHLLKTGIQADVFFLSLHDSLYVTPAGFLPLRDFNGNTTLIQPFAQYQYKVSPTLTFNIGVHYQYLALNGSQNLEPRVGVAWHFTPKDKITFGYGLHSQMLPMDLYYREIPDTLNGVITIIQPSKHLDFSKSHHLVLGYTHNFKKGISFKTELYYQQLYDIAVDKEINTYSTSNFGVDFTSTFPAYLTNNGKGNNYGADFTLEKFLDKGFYFLISSSIYQSFYTASNGLEYNTAFNGNYTFNALVGYEYKLKQGKKRQNSILIDLKFTRNGGKRYTPILLKESIALNIEVRDYEHAYEGRYEDYMKGDLSIHFKMVGSKITQEFGIMIQNFTNNQNVFLRQYDNNKEAITTTYQTGILPIGQYKIYF